MPTSAPLQAKPTTPDSLQGALHANLHTSLQTRWCSGLAGLRELATPWTTLAAKAHPSSVFHGHAWAMAWATAWAQNHAERDLREP